MDPHLATPARWRRRKEARPQEILDAALQVFAEKGFAAARMDDIAARAGVTKGTIYVYYESKEHLFISMVRELTCTTLDTVQEMFERHQGSTASLLRELFGFIYQHIVEDDRRREVVRMLIAEAPRFPALADRYYQEIHRPCLGMLQQVIQRGIDRGEIRPSAVVDCPQVIIAPIALVDLWIMMYGNRLPLDLKAYFEAHIDLVLNGLFVKSAP